ncbi:hypothetical protein [Albidovulum sediminis]|uniref:Sugar transferase n=1 Tax=Albidovulum sediminis TaxID=3066345 RepID=A0ABT2NJR9_9RHOB|nr:hypothetical protein [Defluviimonas sediminis]MCT8328980.1 hypothetical protein [Defluviimonas sediminis]
MHATLEQVLRRLYRERRRLAVVSVLVFVAGYLLYARFGQIQVWGLPAPVFAALLYTGVIGVATLLTALLLPRLRFTIEAMALARVLFAAASALSAPGILPDARAPALQATFVVALAVVLMRVFFSPWAARRLVRHGYVARVTRVSTHSRDALLRALGAGDAGRAGHGWAAALRGLASPDATLDRLIEGAADPATVAAAEDLPGDAGRRILHRTDRGPAPLWREVAIEDLGNRRRVTLTVGHGALPLSAIVTAWLDDSYGRLCDRLIGSAEAVVAIPAEAGVRVEAAAVTA